MSVCAYVSTKFGIVYGSDSQLTPNSVFLEPIKKFHEFTDGSVILGVGEWSVFRKLVIDLTSHEMDIDKIDFKSWLPAGLEGAIEAVLIRPDGVLFSIDSPHGIYQLKRFGFYAMGSGADACLGALHTLCKGMNTKDLTMKQAEEFLVAALSTACVLNEFCNEPIFAGTVTSHITPKKKRA